MPKIQGDPIDVLVARLDLLLQKLISAPEDWFKPETDPDKRNNRTLAPLPCDNWKELVKSWRKALRWTPGLDTALAVMLASCTSVRSVGAQLWIKIIGPPSCGKSTLCEALSVSRYVYAKSTIRGFHSGTASTDGKDHSLIAMIKDKTLVTKDGDTLLQSPNYGQILAEGRDIFDSVSRSHYRNKAGKDYTGIRTTWLLAGTSGLRAIDSSELGERFLDCVIMEGIDDDLEDDILWRVVNRVERTMATEADSNPETHYDPELSRAMRLTGGYVNFLRENATALLSQVPMDSRDLNRTARLGKFVSYMRARPSKLQEEEYTRELAARLAEQHTRLAKCLAVVLNKGRVDEDVMERVKKVAFDTARGVTLGILQYLYYHEDGKSLSAISLKVNRGERETSRLLVFLRGIGVVNPELTKRGKTKRRVTLWRLQDKIRSLYEEVL